MLEDCGMSLGYPEIQHLHINSDGTFTRHIQRSLMTGRRVSIEQNQISKFIIMFSLLDAFIDEKHPHLEGKSFKQKYNDLPATNDYEKILKELFRVAKVLRNALVHNPSSYSESATHIQANYTFKGTTFSLAISTTALKQFYTAIVMYIRGDIGHGAYFIAMTVAIYKEIVAGITTFSDDVAGALHQSLGTFFINPYRRVVVMNPPFSNENTNIRILFDKTSQVAPCEGLDFYITHKGENLLIPAESLDAGMSIGEVDALTQWKYHGTFPPILNLPH
ncbi:hypothetical protein ACQE3D_06340 [Methylomonas sp. MS20]|uniref:hypothetical protein n=1 Tax=unclassified Methylomonas TaxID=2608980 RepID=UPI0028A47A45|nr:hypothetical protein [Methylomonas sp. MV1]MDT4329433.1 hypothetical protein [Methylomonas sp. MV1]